MKMFHWINCEFNANYAGGDIIVIAPTEQEAREKALRHCKKDLKESYGYSQKRYHEKLKELESDLEKRPRSKDSVITLGGSA